MGFNISGLAINKNYKDSFDQLQKELGWTLKKESDIDFETASSNWKEDGICDVYFSENGTLLFISIDMCTESWGLENANTLTFALSETSMAFNLSYCENGIVKRSIMQVEDNRMAEEGEKLEVENKSQDVSEIIWNQMEVVLGKSFWNIDPSEKAERYLFVKEEKAPVKVVSAPSLPKQESPAPEINRSSFTNQFMIEEKINPGTRLGAMILDHFIMCFVMMIFTIPGIILGVSKAFNISHEQKNPDLFGDSMYLMLIGFAVYFCKDSIHGRSPAKRILKLQVVDNSSGKPASPIKCFIRNLFCILWPLEALVALANPERRIGDFVAGTKLVPFQPTTESPKLNWRQIGIALLLGYSAILLIMFSFDILLPSGNEINYIETSYNEPDSKALEQLFADSLGNKLTADIKIYDKIQGEDLKYISFIFRLKKNDLVNDKSFEHLKSEVLPFIYTKFPKETFVGRVQYVYQSGNSSHITTQYLDWREIKR